MQFVTNRVPVARHGVILGEDEAVASRKVFKHPRALPGPFSAPKWAQRLKPENNNNNNNNKNVKNPSLSSLFLELFLFSEI